MVEPTPYYTHRCLECQLMRCTRQNEVCLECQNNKNPPKPEPITFEELQSFDYWGGFKFDSNGWMVTYWYGWCLI